MKTHTHIRTSLFPDRPQSTFAFATNVYTVCKWGNIKGKVFSATMFPKQSTMRELNCWSDSYVDYHTGDIMKYLIRTHWNTR